MQFEIKTQVADLQKYLAGVRKLNALQRMATANKITDEVEARVVGLLNGVADKLDLCQRQSDAAAAAARRHQETLSAMLGESNASEAVRIRSILEGSHDGA